MKRSAIPDSIRKLVMQRAAHRCEYCHLHQKNSFLPFAIEHIVSLKHGGGNEIMNLALACPHCN
jgi:5-methylcytosine-specific restriction endonuclease McrA